MLSLLSLVISVCLFTILTFVCKTVYNLWFAPKLMEKSLREQGFRGNPYRPVFGDTKELMSAMKAAQSKSMELYDDHIMPHVHPHYFHLTSLYGENHFMWMGPKPSVNIVDPKLVKDVFSKYEVFQKPKLKALGKLFMTGLVGKEGGTWVKHRSILNPAFHLEKLKLMVPAMYLSCSEMISKWEELLSGKDSCEVDVHPYLTNLSADVISRTAFGSNYEEGRKIFQLITEENGLILQLFQLLYIPGGRYLPTKGKRRMKQIYKEMSTLLRDIISRREKAFKEKGESSNDLLGILVKTNLEGIEEQGNYKKTTALSTEDIVGECKLFYKAGQETTSGLLSWTMVMFCKYKEWQDRARDEVKAVFGDNVPDYNGLTKLKVVTMILYEVLRLYPPISKIHRVTHEETKLGNYVLPPEVEVSIPILAVHTNREIWGKDAMEFNPERFANGISNATTEKSSVFLPLGGGPRICIGQNFAMIEARLAVAMILQRFSLHLSPSYVHSPSAAVAMLKPQHGIPVILRKL